MGVTTRNGDVRRRLPVVAVGFATASAISLVLPWVRTGDRTRSSIQLIASAGALDIIEGPSRVAVVVLWFLVPALVAAAMLALAAGRSTLTTVLLAPLGFVLAAMVGLLVVVAGSVVVWGAWLTGGFAAGATIVAIVFLIGSSRTSA